MLMNVKNVRELQKYLEKEQSSNLGKVMRDILNDLNLPVNYITFSGLLKNKEVELLRSLGYHVEWSDGCMWYKISWKTKEGE